MGLFLSMSGVIGADEAAVVTALRDYAIARNGNLTPEPLTTKDDGCLVISQGIGGVTVLYPGDFFDWENASEYLSRELRTSAFSFHIHDGDLWMYVLFDNGREVDQFNPVPDYWDENEDRSAWQGNAKEVATRVPGLNPESISKYLVQWGDDVFESDERKKAYPDDRFCYGDDWQLVDFMNRLGLVYPVGDDGSPHGESYRFTCESNE